MKRSVYIVIVCCFFIQFGLAEEVKTPNDEVLIWEKTEITDKVDFGIEKYEFSFPFKNTSDKVVKIVSTETGCSCTVTKLEKQEYKQDEIGGIKGVFKFKGRYGIQNRVLTVKIITDAKVSEKQLKLVIFVPSAYELSSKYVIWGKKDNEKSKKVRLNINTPEPINILPVKHKNLEISVKKLNEGKEYDLIFERKEKKLFASLVKFSTDFEKKPQFTVFVRSNISPPQIEQKN